MLNQYARYIQHNFPEWWKNDITWDTLTRSYSKLNMFFGFSQSLLLYRILFPPYRCHVCIDKISQQEKIPRFKMRSLSFLVTALAAIPLATSQTTFTNPVIYEDFADNDVFYNSNDGYFYFSASNMQYSPGAPLLQSKDLVNWEVIGHSLPDLPFSSTYNLTNGNAYNKGTWASTVRYRKSNKTWYWIGCIEFSKTYVYTAPAPTGPWSVSGIINTCYYDCGLLIDDDDSMYVIYGNGDHSIAQLSSDGLSQVKTTVVFGQPSGQSGVEGNRLYKRNGYCKYCEEGLFHSLCRMNCSSALFCHGFALPQVI
jgi:hypothetical protein